MTVNELIRKLELIEKVHGNAKVRLALGGTFPEVKQVEVIDWTWYEESDPKHAVVVRS